MKVFFTLIVYGLVHDIRKISLLTKEDPIKFQVFLDHLSISEARFGMVCATSKCEMLLRDWVSSKSDVQTV